jgi:hypothetical protein
MLPVSAKASLAEVTYAGVLSDGQENGSSLAGLTAYITLNFFTENGIYTSTPTSSSLIIPPGSPPGSFISGWLFIGSLLPSQDPALLAIGYEQIGIGIGGFGFDIAQIGSTQQLARNSRVNELFTASVSNPLIPGSILQDFHLEDTPMAVHFALDVNFNTYTLNLSGDITHGEFIVGPDVPMPPSLPLFLTSILVIRLFKRINGSQRTARKLFRDLLHIGEVYRTEIEGKAGWTTITSSCCRCYTQKIAYKISIAH